MSANYERLSAQDASFLEFEKLGAPMTVGGPSIFEIGPLAAPEGGVDIDRIRAHFASHIHLIPRYRQRLAYVPISRHPVWVDDDRFHLNYHVRHISLPRPGSERQLKQITAWILSQPLDWRRPLWESWIVEGLANGRFALVTKTHHCMVDGVSGVDLIYQLMRPTPETSVDKPVHWMPRPAPTDLELLAGEVTHHIQQPLGLVHGLGHLIQEPTRTAAEVGEGITAAWNMLSAGLAGTPETPLNQPIGTERRFDWMSVDLAEVKKIKNQLGGTVNDVVLATVAGAVRRFLKQRGVKVDALDLRALVPVNVRAAAEPAVGNRVSAWFTPLPVHLRDPRQRLAAVSRSTAALKQRHEARAAEMMNQITELADSVLTLAVRLVSRMHPYHLVVTNVRGPSFPLYFMGARLLEGYPVVPLFANQGLAVGLFSYADRIFWGFNADWDLVPDLATFVEDTELSFRELQRAARGLDLHGRQPAARSSGRRHTPKKAPRRAVGRAGRRPD